MRARPGCSERTSHLLTQMGAPGAIKVAPAHADTGTGLPAGVDCQGQRLVR